TPTVEFEVTAPGGPVFAAVSVPVSGKPAWAPDGVALTKDSSGKWRGSLPSSTPIEWKATRGSWSTVEKTASMAEVKNRSAQAGTTAQVSVARWADEKSELHDLGDFTPSRLGTPRKVVVRVPLGYAVRTDETYPVLVVLDGQNVFDPSRSFGGVSWRLDLAAEAHDKAGRAPFIAVAIDNTNARIDEYTPSRDPSYGGGRLEDFAAFVLDELLPEIARRYRAKTGPDDTGMLGSSLGGLASFHVGWKHSDRVRRVGAVSPSFWWNNQETRALVAGTASQPPVKLWIDIGTQEGGNPQSTLTNTRAVANLIPTAKYTEISGGQHNEAWWAARLPDVLAYLFP
ncbi:MAG: alpha/beta hydrolase-fold protein, partial [Planctomycetota bacterium]